MSESIFPTIVDQFNENYGDTKEPVGGLTKREYFAGLAMQGLLVNMGRNRIRDAHHAAQEAVECADALIEQLNQSEGDDV